MWDRTLSQLIGGPDRAEVPYDALMPRRVSNLLLVGSLYDYYTIIEDGRLSEMILSEYLDLDLRFTPSLERVSTAEEALEKLRSEPFDLVISMARIGEMNIAEFGASVQQISPGIPVVLLASSGRELSMLPPVATLEGMDSSFVWLGDVRIFLAIIKYIEDRQNAMHDAQLAGVKIILLIEDSVHFYSSYLPMLYTEILNQTHALTELSINRAQKVMRMRARPKVLLAKTYEEAVQLYDQYRDHLLGAIVDAAFPKAGRVAARCGFPGCTVVPRRYPGSPPGRAIRCAQRRAGGGAGTRIHRQEFTHASGRPEGFHASQPRLRRFLVSAAGWHRHQQGSRSAHHGVGHTGGAGCLFALQCLPERLLSMAHGPDRIRSGGSDAQPSSGR